MDATGEEFILWLGVAPGVPFQDECFGAGGRVSRRAGFPCLLTRQAPYRLRSHDAFDGEIPSERILRYRWLRSSPSAAAAFVMFQRFSSSFRRTNSRS